MVPLILVKEHIHEELKNGIDNLKRTKSRGKRFHKVPRTCTAPPPPIPARSRVRTISSKQKQS